MVIPPTSRPINLLVIHHSASPLNTTVEQIEEWHRARGWAGIGYHHVITADGVIRDGRSLLVQGAHTAGVNATSIGLCLVGDNTQPGLQWTGAQRRALAEYVRWFRVFFPYAEVLGHRDVPGAATLCPGLDVLDLLKEIG